MQWSYTSHHVGGSTGTVTRCGSVTIVTPLSSLELLTNGPQSRSMSSLQFYPLDRHPRTGEPFIRLPPPHDRIIVTPPRADDVANIVVIMNDPAVRKWLDGPPFPYLASHAEEWVVRLKHQSDGILHLLRQAAEVSPDGPLVIVPGNPVSCVREVHEDGREEFLGALTFSRCEYPDVQDLDEVRRLVGRNEQKRVGDQEIVWCSGCECIPQGF